MLLTEHQRTILECVVNAFQTGSAVAPGVVLAASVGSWFFAR